jgi:hypothetical protein
MHYVYLVAFKEDERHHGPVKIGHSENLGRRISSLRTDNHDGHKLVFYRVVPFPNREMAMVFEATFHRRHDELCLHREWFNLEPEQAWIMAMDLMRDLFRHENPSVSDDLLSEIVELTERFNSERSV